MDDLERMRAISVNDVCARRHVCVCMYVYVGRPRCAFPVLPMCAYVPVSPISSVLRRSVSG